MYYNKVAFATVLVDTERKRWVIRRDIDGGLRQVRSRSIKVVPVSCGVDVFTLFLQKRNEAAKDDSNDKVSTCYFVIDVYCLTCLIISYLTLSFLSDLFNRTSSWRRIT